MMKKEEEEAPALIQIKLKGKGHYNSGMSFFPIHKSQRSQRSDPRSPEGTALSFFLSCGRGSAVRCVAVPCRDGCPAPTPKYSLSSNMRIRLSPAHTNPGLGFAWSEIRAGLPHVRRVIVLPRFENFRFELGLSLAHKTANPLNDSMGFEPEQKTVI